MTNIYFKIKNKKKLFETQKSYMDPVGIANFYDIYTIFFFGLEHTFWNTKTIEYGFTMQKKVFILKCYILIIADTHQE